MELSKKDLNYIAKQLHSLQIEKEEKQSIKHKERRLNQFKKQMKDHDFVKDTIIEMIQEDFDEDEGIDDYNTLSMLYHLYYEKYEKLKEKAEEIKELILKINLNDLKI